MRSPSDTLIMTETASDVVQDHRVRAGVQLSVRLDTITGVRRNARRPGARALKDTAECSH